MEQLDICKQQMAGPKFSVDYPKEIICGYLSMYQKGPTRGELRIHHLCYN